MKKNMIYILLTVFAVLLMGCPSDIDWDLLKIKDIEKEIKNIQKALENGESHEAEEHQEKDDDDDAHDKENGHKSDRGNYYEEKAHEPKPPLTFSVSPNAALQGLALTVTRTEVDVDDTDDDRYFATFITDAGISLMVTGTYNKPFSLTAVGLVHNREYTLSSIKDLSSDRYFDMRELKLQFIPHIETIKFTPYYGNGAGSATYTLSSNGLTYSYSSSAGGFAEVLTHYIVNGILSNKLKNFTINSDRDVAWNYCQEADKRSCNIWYYARPYTSDDVASVYDEKTKAVFVKTATTIHTNILAVLAHGIESDESVAGVHNDCLVYSGVQDKREVIIGEQEVAGFTDRYIDYYSRRRFMQGTTDLRPYSSADKGEPTLLIGGMLYPHYVTLDYSTLGANTQMSTDIYRVNFANYELVKEARDVTVTYCSTERFKYYVLYQRDTDGLGHAGIVTERFTP